MADLEGQAATTRQTKFRIGSVSKPLTSAAVGLLFQEGQLDLDAPVQRYVPSFPAKRWPITTRELAGILPAFASIPKESSTARNTMRRFSMASVSSPGTRYCMNRERRSLIPHTVGISSVR
jgi:hypothetical protein